MGKLIESTPQPLTQKMFGNNLRYLRIKKNETQEMIGYLIDLSSRTISLIEQGKFKQMDLAHIVILSSHFGVSIDDIMTKDLSSPDTPDDRKRIKFSKEDNLPSLFEQDTGQPQNKAAPPDTEGVQTRDLETELLRFLLEFKERKNTKI